MDAAGIVKRVRALGGINRKELAELADVSPSTISRIERGVLDPTWGMLSRILEATGFRISGDTIVSAGDTAAILAARSVFKGDLHRDPHDASAIEAETARWLQRWERAGWLVRNADVDDMLAIAVSAGNAAKISRRDVARRFVAAATGWRDLARRLGEGGVPYAVSGLIATRDDKDMAGVANPMIYVENPEQVIQLLGLTEVNSGAGVLLLAPTGGELNNVVLENGIRFVTRFQGVLDAFAGMGREPDKAEDALRYLLEVGT